MRLSILAMQSVLTAEKKVAYLWEEINLYLILEILCKKSVVSRSVSKNINNFQIAKSILMNVTKESVP